MNFKSLETAQKLRGGYYTQPDIAAFLAKWVLEGNPERILEPSAGDGAFIGALQGLDHTSVKTVVACEIDKQEAAAVRKRAESLKGIETVVHASDFLEWSLTQLKKPPQFDGALGNPPFIRYQYLDSELQERSERIFNHFHLPFTKHTNAWVPFVLASLGQLRPGGRLAMVVPSEILHVIHARPLRDFLLKQCSKVLILDPEDIWFGETLQGVVLLLAEKAEVKGIAKVSVKSVKDRETLNGSASKHFAKAVFTCGSNLNGKWMLSLLSPAEQSLLIELSQHRSVKRFADIADVDVGIVTGANKFFLVPDDVVAEYGLQKWVHPMFGRSDHVRGVIYDKQSHEENRKLGLPTNFVWFKKDEKVKDLPSTVQRYLRLGESEKLPTRFKCRVRSPWYSVPSVYTTPVAMLKRAHHFPRLILNRANAYTTDTAYRIEPKIDPITFVASFVNSLTMLTTELEGRHYGGGVLELVPSEIEKVLVPIPKLPASALTALDEAIRKESAPEITLARQDQIVLKPLGITPQQSGDLLAAWTRLRLRRQRSSGEAEGGE